MCTWLTIYWTIGLRLQYSSGKRKLQYHPPLAITAVASITVVVVVVVVVLVLVHYSKQKDYCKSYC